jgi:hypothetical protein
VAVSAALVWAWLVLGLGVLSGNGAWQLGLFGCLAFGTLLWPAFVLGYLNLARAVFGPYRVDVGSGADVREWAASTGLPVLFLGLLWSTVLLGLMRFVDSFAGPQPRGAINFMMSILALHVFAWGGAGLTQWALASRRAHGDSSW